MPLVAGVDSSTQSCKVVVCDAETGAVVRSGHAPHPEGTEVAPEAWWDALQAAIAAAGGLDDVAAVAVGGQQHGMVCLDAAGDVVRPALLWNDTRSAQAALDLIDELGGPQAWVDAVGLVPVASFTVTKLRWLRDAEPDNARRTAAVCLPHDYLTWRLAGAPSLDALVTDRGDASGTGYWSPATGEYRRDLLDAGPRPRRDPAAGARPRRVRAVDALGRAARSRHRRQRRRRAGPRRGRRRRRRLDRHVGRRLRRRRRAGGDVSGAVAGFADATGRFLPLVATLNAARVLDAACRMLGVSHEELSELALSAPAGAGGLVLVPYLEGERTPNKPDATGAIHGLRLETANPAYLARAAVEGMICGLADAVDAVRALGTPVERIILVGGAARSRAVREIASAVLGLPVSVPEPGEYVARGAARQAAWVLAGGAEPPQWPLSGVVETEVDPTPAVRERYASVRDLTAPRP